LAPLILGESPDVRGAIPPERRTFVQSNAGATGSVAPLFR